MLTGNRMVGAHLVNRSVFLCVSSLCVAYMSLVVVVVCMCVCVSDCL